ncbi:MAG: hypothetical protein EOO65_04655, partial [Methanosarcinales archaeon]
MNHAVGIRVCRNRSNVTAFELTTSRHERMVYGQRPSVPASALPPQLVRHSSDCTPVRRVTCDSHVAPVTAHSDAHSMIHDLRGEHAAVETTIVPVQPEGAADTNSPGSIQVISPPFPLSCALTAMQQCNPPPNLSPLCLPPVQDGVLNQSAASGVRQHTSAELPTFVSKRRSVDAELDMLAAASPIVHTTDHHNTALEMDTPMIRVEREKSEGFTTCSSNSASCTFDGTLPTPLVHGCSNPRSNGRDALYRELRAHVVERVTLCAPRNVDSQSLTTCAGLLPAAAAVDPAGAPQAAAMLIHDGPREVDGAHPLTDVSAITASQSPPMMYNSEQGSGGTAVFATEQGLRRLGCTRYKRSHLEVHVPTGSESFPSAAPVPQSTSAHALHMSGTAIPSVRSLQISARVGAGEQLLLPPPLLTTTARVGSHVAALPPPLPSLESSAVAMKHRRADASTSSDGSTHILAVPCSRPSELALQST